MLYSNSKPRYFPHLDKPEVLLMGLEPVEASSWIEPDEDLPLYLDNKTLQRENLGPRVYRAMDESLSGQLEARALLLNHLLRDHADCYSRQEDTLIWRNGKLSWQLTTEDPLWQASTWIEDDLVLMSPRGDDYIISAASLACASHWLLEEKFGEPLASVHQPIPRFNEQLTPSVTRFFKHLRAEHLVQRFNWSVQRGDQLNDRPGTDEHSNKLYWRTERQSLRRLPKSGDILFTIRVYIHPLDCLQAKPGAVAALMQAIEATPPDVRAYKGFDELWDELRDWSR